MHRQCLCEEGSKNNFSGEPEDANVTLANSIPNPMVLHIHTLGAVLLDGVVGKAYGTLNVTVHGSGGLRMANSSQDGTGKFFFLSNREESAIFSFTGKGDDDV